ncbi:MAG: Rpn family recombination-promoting nuclease/putative transposase, partial [Planctomycetaceae bacterium]|nr:Rpn family recombination-promoting nuclease/putative transposase [Planctomycetaceae bacterium]
MIAAELAHPHDLLVRRFLFEPELMADLLTYYPQSAADRRTVQLLDLRELRCESPVNVDENLAEAVGDLRFTAGFRGCSRRSNVFLLFEHQSKIDRRIRLRGLDYIVQSYKHFEERSKGKTLFPYPVAVLLYHGKSAWRDLPEMDDMMDRVSGAERGLLRFPLILIDLSVISRDNVKGHPALRTLVAVLQLASAGKLASGFDGAMDPLAGVKDDPRVRGWVQSFVRYALSVSKIGKELVIKAFSKILDEKEAQKMFTSTAQELMYKGEV